MTKNKKNCMSRKCLKVSYGSKDVLTETIHDDMCDSEASYSPDEGIGSEGASGCAAQLA